MLKCEVPVGYKCTFDVVLNGEQVLLLTLGIIGLIALTIVTVSWLIYLNERSKRK